MILPVSRCPSQILFAALALAVVGAAEATPESLLRNSPFLPAGNVAAVAAPQNGRLELRGIVALEGKTRFAVFDTANNRSVWLAVGESDSGLRVTAYDATSEAVTVEFEGQSVRLTMKEPQIVNVAVNLAGPVAAAPAPGLAGPQPTAGPALSEPEIQERRNRIIEELRRRRALRQTSGQPGGPPLPQPMPQGQPQPPQPPPPQP